MSNDEVSTDAPGTFTVDITPDRPPQGTYDPLDDILREAKLVPGYVSVSTSIYYREWIVVLTFRSRDISRAEAQRRIMTLVNQFSDRWGTEQNREDVR